MHTSENYAIVSAMNSDEILKENAFLIDSNSLENTESRLIGFMIGDDGTFYQHTLPPQHSDTGVFVLIERKDDTISIRQDGGATFGLFFYQDNERFLL